MKNQASYEDLQKKVDSLEEELSSLRAEQTDVHSINQNLFFQISEYSRNGIALFESKDNGKSFIIKYFNNKAAEIENVDRESVIGKKLSDSFPSVKKSGFLEALQRVFQNNKPEEFPAIVFSSGKIIEWTQNYIYKLSEKELVSIFIDEAESKNKENELKEHREKLEIAMEAANYHSFELDFATFKITTYKEIYASLGFETSEIDELVQKFDSLIHPNDYDSIKLLVQNNIQNKISTVYTEFRLKNKKGDWIWFMATGRVIDWDKNKNPIKLVGLLKDIQKKKELLLKLKHSEEKFKSLVTLLPEVVYEADLKGNITYVNLKGLEMFEYTPEDVKNGLNIFQVIAPEETTRAKANFETILNLKNIPGEEYIAQTKSGKRFPVMVYSNAIIENDKVRGLRGIIINISNLKETQKQLKSSQENFLQLSENINDAFWLRSNENKVIYANDACYKISDGYFIELFEDFKKYTQWIHPDDRERIIKQREINLKNPNDNHFYEHRIVKPNGEIRWFWIRTFPVYNESGNLYRRAGIASDITEQKNLMAELLIAKEKAEESDKLKSAFLANMSHEIRTPMNGILGFAELLKDVDITNSEKDEYLRIIDQNGKQLLNLINDIIDIAKIEAGQLSINNSDTEINTLLEETYLLFAEEQKRLNKQAINFSVKLPKNENNTIYTDPIRLQQILNNLLSNAFKFTDSGSISFGYELVNYAKSSYFQFFVSDTGMGINKKMKKFIFERFGQEPTKKFKNYQGTGLGLAISNGLIKLLNGEIWVESTRENESLRHSGGSTFYFTIPVINNTTVMKHNEQEVIIKFDTFENVNILAVEDDEDNLEFLRRLLTKYGANVLLAHSGEEAINIVKENNQINVILMDIRLPDMDGFETTKKIKKINPNLPIIAQTAYAMFNDKEKCLENGCDDYISKPLNKSVLFKKIIHYIYN